MSRHHRNVQARPQFAFGVPQDLKGTEKLARSKKNTQQKESQGKLNHQTNKSVSRGQPLVPSLINNGSQYPFPRLYHFSLSSYFFFCSFTHKHSTPTEIDHDDVLALVAQLAKVNVHASRFSEPEFFSFPFCATMLQ